MFSKRRLLQRCQKASIWGKGLSEIDEQRAMKTILMAFGTSANSDHPTHSMSNPDQHWSWNMHGSFQVTANKKFSAFESLVHVWANWSSSHPSKKHNIGFPWAQLKCTLCQVETYVSNVNLKHAKSMVYIVPFMRQNVVLQLPFMAKHKGYEYRN